MWRYLLMAVALVSAALAQTTVDPDDDSTATVMTTMEPITEFSLAITHLQSGTSSISFKWDAAVPKWMKVMSYTITAAKKDSDSVMTYPELQGTEDSYEVEDLIKEAEWEVCIQSTVQNGTSESETVEYRDCFDSFTIPYIRPDSLYVLFIVIAYILLMILIGYISWRCAVAKQEKEKEQAEAAAAAEEEDNEGKKHANLPEEQKPILLSSPSDDRPKSSIEDEDIPYITPPWSEVEREEREKRAAANSFSHV